MDWGTRHLTVIVGTGAGHLPTKVALRAGRSTNFLPMPGAGLPGGMLTVRIYTNPVLGGQGI